MQVEPEATPMMISLGGAPGPQAGGMNTIADRATQAVAEPAAKPRVEPPPAPKAARDGRAGPEGQARGEASCEADRQARRQVILEGADDGPGNQVGFVERRGPAEPPSRLAG